MCKNIADITGNYILNSYQLSKKASCTYTSPIKISVAEILKLYIINLQSPS